MGAELAPAQGTALDADKVKGRKSVVEIPPPAAVVADISASVVSAVAKVLLHVYTDPAHRLKLFLSLIRPHRTYTRHLRLLPLLRPSLAPSGLVEVQQSAACEASRRCLYGRNRTLLYAMPSGTIFSNRLFQAVETMSVSMTT